MSSKFLVQYLENKAKTIPAEEAERLDGRGIFGEED